MRNFNVSVSHFYIFSNSNIVYLFCSLSLIYSTYQKKKIGLFLGFYSTYQDHKNTLLLICIFSMYKHKKVLKGD